MTLRSLCGMALLLLVACHAEGPPSTPEEVCQAACVQRASHVCVKDECFRGCRLAIDRVIEHEGNAVVACVASSKNRRCDPMLWADCAARIGPHADGGPPIPRLQTKDEEEGE